MSGVTVGDIVGGLRKIANRRPADRHMANAFLRCREEARALIQSATETGSVSDGYHSFDELYAHRCALFIALMRERPALSWRARLHADGVGYDGWWIGGMDLSTGSITYHLPDSAWRALDNVFGLRTLDRAPGWDGHTSADVLERLRRWCAIPP